jgi:predicted amidohydrolase YtcJ
MLMSADLVLLEGKILTMNPNQPNAEAVAVKGNKIIQVGTNENVSELIGKDTKVIHLNGKAVLPGFIDTHIHLADYGRLLTWLNLENADSIKQIQSLLSQRIKQTLKGKWILGRGWNENCLAEKRPPTRFELDQFSPETPVVLYHQSGQVCIVNSKALEIAKVKPQESVGVEKNPKTGEPTGILRDDATNLVWQVVPEPTQDELYHATEKALVKVVEAGITSIHWIVLSEAELPIIKKLVEANALPLRVYLIVPANLLDSARATLKNIKNEHFKLGGAVIFADGYLASRTAALIEPYSDASFEQGKLLCSKQEMLTLADKIHAAGLQLIIHAVGDKAVDQALTVIKEISKPSALPPPRLEQAAVLNQQLVQRIKTQKIIVSIQPCVVASEFLVWSAANRLGEKRAKWLFPVKTLLDMGVLVTAGSDCPMEPLNPLLGITAAVKREAFREQQVDIMDTLRMYTVNAAYASSEETIKGSIEVGKLADFAVLSNDPNSVSTEKISEISVCMTVLDGKVFCSKS